MRTSDEHILGFDLYYQKILSCEYIQSVPQHIQEARYVIESVIYESNFEGLVLGWIEADFCK